MLDKEKLQWLESIGAKAYPEPVKWAYAFPGYEGAFNLSERYIEETPLEVLKAQYIINADHVRLCLEAKKNGMRLAKVLNKVKCAARFKIR